MRPSVPPPVIDISALRVRPGGSDAASARSRIHRACTGTGFFVAVGHGLDAEMSALFNRARWFFSLPQVDKEAVPRTNRYGFVPHADHAIDRARKSDNTEFIDIGLHDEIPLPDEVFEHTVRRYQTAALAVAHTLLETLATGLGIAATFFAEHMTDPQCRLRLLHYPAVRPRADGSLPVPTSPHTDYGLITLLATDGVPGLEVRPLDTDWTPVVAPAGSLVVNLGDMLARWTNDTYRSTPHRVVGPESGDRISIPFFVNPDPDTVIGCIPTCVTADRPGRYEPVTATEFLAGRIDSSAEPYVDPTEGPMRTSTVV